MTAAADMSVATLGAGRGHEMRLQARIVQITLEADDVVSLLLQASDGKALPSWSPGAHVDLHLPSGLVRQYSLCGDPADTSTYRIAILRQKDGRGGSREVHDQLRVAQHVTVSAPRNAFELKPAGRYLFVAGGIGITPILPMLRHAAGSGADWRLVYGARSRRRMAFARALADLDPCRIDLRPDDEHASVDVGEILAAARTGCEIYACGPRGLLDALEERFGEEGLSARLNLERFAAAAATLPGDGSIRIVLARSGGHVDVPADASILEALRRAGHDLPSSCEQGFCGTCECGVLEGIPDHRDTLLNDKERLAGKVMMPCVSRALTPTLTLDI